MENRKISETEIRENIEKYVEVIKTVDPELYQIKLSMLETNINPRILPKIIRAIALLALGTSYGQIEIHMKSGEITQIKTYESSVVSERAILIKD